MASRDKIRSIKSGNGEEGLVARRSTNMSQRELRAIQALTLMRCNRLSFKDEPSMPDGAVQARVSQVAELLRSGNDTEALRVISAEITTSPVFSERLVSNAEIVSHIFNVFNSVASYEMLLQAAKCLKMLTSINTNTTFALVNAGLLRTVASALSTTYSDVACELVWSVGNVASDVVQLRDAVLAAGFVTILSSLIDGPLMVDIEIPRLASWAVSNLSRFELSPSDVSLVAAMAQKLLKLDDMEILMNMANTLALLKPEPAVLEIITASGVVPRVVDLIAYSDSHVSIPCIRTVGHITLGTPEQIKALLETPLLRHLKAILESTRGQAIKEAIWVLSNLCGTTEELVARVVDAGLIQLTIPFMSSSMKDLRREAIWTITNVTFNGKKGVAQFLVKHSCVIHIAWFLSNAVLSQGDAPLTIVTALECLDNLLKDESCASQVINEFRFHQGVEALYRLQNHSAEKVFQYAQYLLTEYFSEESMNEV